MHACTRCVSDTSLIDSDDGMPSSAAPVRSQSPEYSRQQPQQQQKQMEAKPGRMTAMPSGGAAKEDGGDDGEPIGYNANEFKHLNVSDDVRELFKFIGRYQVRNPMIKQVLSDHHSTIRCRQAHNIDLETKLKPFVPDYIPSVGSIDEFIKVPRSISTSAMERHDLLVLPRTTQGAPPRRQARLPGPQGAGRSGVQAVRPHRADAAAP